VLELQVFPDKLFAWCFGSNMSCDDMLALLNTDCTDNSKAVVQHWTSFL